MRKYEIMYILMPRLSDEERKAEMDKLHAIITNNGGKVNDVKEMGLRELAYEIKKQIKGFYVVIKVEAETIAINEFDRLAKIDVNVIRHLTVLDRD